MECYLPGCVELEARYGVLLTRMCGAATVVEARYGRSVITVGRQGPTEKQLV